MKLKSRIIAIISVVHCTLAFGEVPVESRVGFDKKPKDSSYLEWVKYKQIVHSSSSGFEIGEQTEVQAAFKYHPTEKSSFRLRFNTDPKKNPVENKTSKLELIMKHQVADFEIQLDVDLKFDEYGEGATTLGPDTDSDYSFISYKPNDTWALTFYPFNFNGEVGREFYTNDVTRIYYIEGTPAVIPGEPVEDTEIRTKTLPGFDIKYNFMDSMTLTLGMGVARYKYPNNANFEIAEDIAADSWAARSDTAYKLGLDYRGRDTSIVFKVVSHDKSEETGSLLKAAANLQVEQRLGKLTLGFEGGYSHAGSKAYDISYDSRWFAQTTPFRPIFEDDYDQRHSWLGEEDYAYFLKASYEVSQGLSPFLSVKSLGQNFVYWEDESVHRLRSGDSAFSHGGLQIMAAGLKISRGGYTITPEYEYMLAKNEVFGSKNDLRSEDKLTERHDKQSRFTFNLTYSL